MSHLSELTSSEPTYLVACCLVTHCATHFTSSYKIVTRFVVRRINLLDVSDAPVYLSFPHFYKADPALISQFEGLNPTQEKHETFFKIQPVSFINLINLYNYNLTP